MRSKRDRAHLKVVKNYHVFISRTGKVPNIYDVISYIMTSSPWRSLFAWRVTYILTWYVMCSSNVHTHICIDQGKDFSQRMTSNKTHESVQITKPNHNDQQARGSSSRGLVLNLVRKCRWVNLSYFKYWYRYLLTLWYTFFMRGGFWSMEHRPPPPLRDTQLPFDMLFITMFYTYHVKEVVYHRGEQLRIRKSLKLYHAGHTHKASRISKAVVDNCSKGVCNFYLS